ncbi:MAG: tyrosinase family protein [Candidatus Electrothrix sp. GM3_4]|nr:tyrosinase family protein [Candidatus Electrothrix sp. GM3_4]
MQSRSLDDESSWWFFAAIHGEYVDESSFPGWGSIPGPPAVPNKPVPSQKNQDTFWNQCQHQSWYFTPWHRGYLIALEDQIRAAIIRLGGPSDWALPYWNYLGPDNEFNIPPAFTEKNLPDGSPNPLAVNARFGPNNDKNIFIEIPPVSETCQNNTIYTGSNGQTPSPGYGGPSTGFSHGGGVNGNLEGNPHNIVHVQVGGRSSIIWGLMSDPGIAALDPIFYLHHSNIDRMWAAWNTVGNSNPTHANWLNGPTAIGARKFIMPMANGSSWTYTPADVNSLELLDYDYDDLQLAQTPILADAITKRFTKLNVSTENLSIDKNMNLGKDSELIGANQAPMELKSSGIKTKVKFLKKALNVTRKSLMEASISNLPDEVYLQLESVKGGMDANILSVSINEKLAGHISLFGLRNASKQDCHHGGEGLTFILNITDIFDDLHINNILDINSIDVNILPKNSIFESQKLTIGRVSIYREQQSL